MALKIISSNCSIALFLFINSEFQNVSYGYASTGAMIQSCQVGVSFYSQASLHCFKITNYRNRLFGIWRNIHSSKQLMQSLQCSLFRNNQISLSCKCIVFECYLYTYLSGFADQIFAYLEYSQKIFVPFLLNGMHISFWSCVIVTLYHSFCACHDFLVLIGK